MTVAAKLGADVKLENGCVVGVGMHLENRVLSDRTHCYIHDGMIQERTGRDFPPVCIFILACIFLVFILRLFKGLVTSNFKRFFRKYRYFFII